MKRMKLTYAFLIAIMILTSCSSDDNNDDGTDSSIIGTWTGISSSFNGQNSGIPDNNIVKFTSDNRTEFIYEGFGTNGQDISEFGDWTKSGNTLTINWDDADQGLGTYTLTITELTENSLNWETEISGEGTLKESFQKNESSDTESYFHGSWSITEAKKENGENLLILCTNGELPNYTFTSNNELNATLYIGSASNIGDCQTENRTYNYAYDSATNILTYTNQTGSTSEYKSEIIEMSENRFKTRYVSGNISLQTTVPNFTRVYERN